jgi:hypothetical protein
VSASAQTTSGAQALGSRGRDCASVPPTTEQPVAASHLTPQPPSPWRETASGLAQAGEGGFAFGGADASRARPEAGPASPAAGPASHQSSPTHPAWDGLVEVVRSGFDLLIDEHRAEATRS